MPDIRNLRMVYRKAGSVMEITAPAGEKINDSLVSIELRSKNEGEGIVKSLTISANEPIEILEFSMDTDISLDCRKVQINGYQTWTESYDADGSFYQKGLNPIVSFLLKPYGDYSFYKHKKIKGFVYSYTYICIKGSDASTLLGSIDETHGYTVFEADYNKNSIRITKDCTGVSICGKYEILKLYIGEGAYNKVWDEYSMLFSSVPKGRNAGKCTGWTSWYNYYTGITEEIILKNLKGIKDNKIPIDVFQIDDGYQRAVGDWLSINGKFPRGMKYLAQEIKKAGFRPGLWLAPLVCEKKSVIYENHRDWLLKDSKGRAVKAGWNPNWSGWFYALDIYNTEFREYLKKVFNTVLDIWGFEMVKLDFLYGAAVIHREDKSRAQVMDDAMGFLRELCGDRWILGCGVPLASAFNRVDYCRVGADVAPYWEDNKLKAAGYRERVSTRGALSSIINRSSLNNRFFMNDPDVFFLRDSNIKLNSRQKYTLFFLNNLLGSLIFFSDDIEEYSKEKIHELKSIFPPLKPCLCDVNMDGETCRVQFSIGERKYISFSNLSGEGVCVKLDDGMYYYKEGKTVKGPCGICLLPYETKCLLRILDDAPGGFIGSDGYIFPSAEIENIKLDGSTVSISYKEGFINQGRAYFIAGDGVNEMIVNGKCCPSYMENGIKMISYERA